MTLLWLKAFHIIFVITWFAGLFYLPRLFVYHAELLKAPPHDVVGHQRFCIMERRLFWGIMTPSAVLAILFGLLTWGSYGWLAFKGTTWLHLKLLLVGVIIGHHYLCGRYMLAFRKQTHTPSATYFRFFNEFPVLILIAIVLLVVLKPF
jgi:putative membrane protein